MSSFDDEPKTDSRVEAVAKRNLGLQEERQTKARCKVSQLWKPERNKCKLSVRTIKRKGKQS